MRLPVAANADDILWQNDLAVLRSMQGRVPWDQRFGQGQIKVLSYDLETEGGTFLFHWPADYDPLGRHGHAGNEELYVLDGELHCGETVYGPGAYVYTPRGETHGPFTPGPEGCLFLLAVDGPLVDEEYVQELLTAAGKAPRRRA